MKRYLNFLLKFYKVYILKDEFSIAIKKWFKDEGDSTLRFDYPLNQHTVVFDIGGYQGNFAEEIFKRYGCSIYIFEPIEKFYIEIKNKFAHNSKIKVFNFGLSNCNTKELISIDNDASSVFKNSTGVKSNEEITLVGINEFVEKYNIQKIDLMKINIEGDEFNILPLIIDYALIKKIENLQVQFHTFVPNAINMRNSIRKNLQSTHILTYDYYFV